jgi:Entner-Doudoroff aldolase
VHGDFFRNHLHAAPVVAILRGMDPRRTVDTARACWDLGVRLVEVPLQGVESRRAFDAAAAHSDAQTRLLGAGTVRSPEDVSAAQEAGARFLVSPGVLPDTVSAATAAGLPILPGVFTPTEVEAARRLGCTVQKLFPAGLLGPAAVSALRGPYPEIGLVAVGGVTPQETETYLRAGATGVGLGSALAGPSALDHLRTTLTTLRKDST